MHYEKPLTENIKQKGNTLFLFLKKHKDYVTKEEIGKYLNIKNERTIRDIISELAKRKPIISKSNGKGYKLAQTAADMDELINAWREIDSRIEELERRKAPMIVFRESVLKAQSDKIKKVPSLDEGAQS